MREHAMRHHRVAIIRSRSGPNHVRVIRAVIVAVARGGLRFVNRGARRHAAVDAPDSLVSGPARLIEMDRNLDAMVLDALEAADRLAENDARAGIFAGDVEYFLRGADLVGG